MNNDISDSEPDENVISNNLFSTNVYQVTVIAEASITESHQCDDDNNI